MNSQHILLMVLMACGTAVLGLPAPQSVNLGGGEVGASFGGYSASAGLGGLLGGKGAAAGGLHAEAGTGSGGPSAAAGLGGLLAGGGGGGGKLYSGASTGSFASGNAVYGSGGSGKGGFYDRIFDIPISTLQAVNRLLTEGSSGTSVRTLAKSRTKVTGDQQHSVATSKSKVKTVSKQFWAPPQTVYQPLPPANVGAGAFASASSSSSGSTTSSGAGVASGGAQQGGFYDRVFDIPISVLNAVNRLLNGKPSL